MILVIQHEDDCPPALVGDWLGAEGCELDVRRPFAGDDLPPVETYAGLLVLGGALGANDFAEGPWLAATQQLVRDAVAAGVPTLGICLGHQVIAAALGGTVARRSVGRQRGLLDTGWLPAAGDDAVFGSPSARATRGVHWNDDVVVDLPPGAEALARTPDGSAQVVRHAPLCWGVQHHPEVGVEMLRRWGATAGDPMPEDMLGDIAAAEGDLEASWRPPVRTFGALTLHRAATA